MANQWFKFYGGEYLSDTKIATFSAQERSCWVTVMCLASVATIPGIIEFLTVEVLLKKSGIECDPYDLTGWENSLLILKKFENMRMIQTHENGKIEVLNWAKRQEHPMTVTERVRKYRVKTRLEFKNETDVTKCNESETTEENRIEENRIEKNREKDTRNTKEIYGEFENVKLRKEEIEKLIEKMGERNTRVMVEKLSAYIASKGKKYVSHYATILNWARREVDDYQKSRKADRKIV